MLIIMQEILTINVVLIHHVLHAHTGEAKLVVMVVMVEIVQTLLVNV